MHKLPSELQPEPEASEPSLFLLLELLSPNCKVESSSTETCTCGPESGLSDDAAWAWGAGEEVDLRRLSFLERISWMENEVAMALAPDALLNCNSLGLSEEWFLGAFLL